MHGFRLLIALTLLVHATAAAQGPASPSSQRAPSPQAKEEAGARFERGVQLYKEQAFRAALVEFQRAYALAPDYRLLYNIGRTQHHLTDYLGASQSYETYLVEGGADIAPERRAQVEEMLASLRSRVGRLSIQVSRDDAEVFVDDVRVGTSPLSSLVLTNVGRHRVSARAPDGAAGVEIVDVAGGDVIDVQLQVAALQVAASSVRKRRDEESERALSTPRKVALAGGILGGSLLAAGVVTGILSLSSKNELRSQVDTLGVSQSEVAHQRDKVDKLSLSTDVLLGVGAAAVVTGTILWLVSPSERAPKKAARTSPMRVDVGVRSLSLTGRF